MHTRLGRNLKIPLGCGWGMRFFLETHHNCIDTVDSFKSLIEHWEVVGIAGVTVGQAIASRREKQYGTLASFHFAAERLQRELRIARGGKG